MDRLGYRRSRGHRSFQTGASQRHLLSKRKSGQSTKEAVRAWVESLEIRQLLSASDLAVMMTGPQYAQLGGQAFYQVTVTNNGLDDVQNLVPTFTSSALILNTNQSLPSPKATQISGPQGGTLPAGSSESFQVMQSVPVFQAVPEYVFTEFASANGPTNSDPNGSNNTASVKTNAVFTTTLKATVTAPAAIPIGQNNVTFSITVTNSGPNVAQNVVLTDLLPSPLTFVSAVQTSGAAAFNLVSATPGANSPVTAIASSMPVGSATIQITAANPSPVLYQVLTNQVTISGQTINGPAVATGSQDSLQWKYATNLSLQMTGTPVVLAGSFFKPIYTVSVNDLGVAFPTNATLTYVVPDGFTLASVTGPGSSLPAVGSTGTLNIPISSAGIFQFTEAVDPSVPASTIATHSATITTTPTDNDPSDNAASVSTTVFAASDVAVAMKPVPTIPVHGVFNYQLTVSNLGPSVASNVSFADVLPPTLQFESITQTSGPTFTLATPAVGSNGTVSGQIATMLPGSATFTLAVIVAPGVAAGDSITNTATVSTTSSGDISRNDTASVTSVAQTPADLALMAGGDVNPPIGGNTSYPFQVTNNGPANASNIVLVDQLPPQLSFTSVTSADTSGIQASVNDQNVVTITFPSLAAGATANLRLNCVVAPNTLDGTPLVNTATVSSSTADSDPTNNSVEVHSTAQLVSDLSVAITLPSRIIGHGDGEHPPVPVPVLVAGDDNALTFAVTNAGPSIAHNVQVLVPLPAGATLVSATGDSYQLQTIKGIPTVVFMIPAMSSGGSSVETVIYHLDPSTARASATQTATVSSDGVDPNPSNNTASATVTISKPGDLSPTLFGPTIFRAGTLINYVLTVENVGDLNASGGTVTFNIPANAPIVSIGANNLEEVPTIAPGTTGPVTFELYPGLAPGQTESISLFERINPSAPDGSTVVPTATVVPLASDDDASDNSTSLTTNVIAQADVSAAMTGPTNITAGGSATYTITLTNIGPSDAQNVSFLDNLPPGMLFSSLVQTSGAPFSLQTPSPGAVGTASGTGILPAGTSAVFQLVGTLPSNMPAAPNAMTNTVTVSTTTSGDNPINNTASVTSNVVTSADLAVSLIQPGNITAGAPANYQIVVRNNGLSDATSVVIETVLPPSETYKSSADQFGGTVTVIGGGPSGQTIIYSLPNLPAGESDIISIQSTVDPLAPAMPISNNASALSATPDPDPTNNSASVSVPVITVADLRVSLTDESTTPAIMAGDTGKLEVQVTNGGPTYAQNVVVTDTLPVGASLVSITDRSGSGIHLPVAGATGTVSWTIPAMTPGAVDGFDLVYQLGPASEVPTKSDSATASSSTFDPDLANNSATLPLVLQPTELLVNGPAVSRAGTFAQYGFTLDTEGLSAGWRVLTIDVPQGATISAISPPNGYALPPGLIGTNGIIKFPINLPAEDNVAFVITETTPSSTPDGTILTNSAWANFDTSTTQSVSTKILAQADMSAKVTGPAAIVPGTPATYSLKVTNNGPSDAQNVSFTDALPPGMTFQSLTQTSGPTFTLVPLLVGSGGSVSGSVAALPTGASATFTLTGNVPSSLGATSLTDTINVSSPTTDLNSSNNSSSLTTPVQPQADLGVSMSTGISQVNAGSPLTYSITLTNNGPSDAQNIVLNEALAPGVVFSSFGFAASGPFTSSAPHVGANGTVIFQIASMPSHATYTYTVNAAVLPSTPAGPLPSTASVSSSASDPNTANNSVTDTLTQAATSADVKITDTAPMMFIDHGTTTSRPVLHPVFVLGQNNTWVVDVTNTGSSDAQNVTWSSAVPFGVMLESVSQASGPVFTLTTPTGGTGTISGNIATLPAGQTAEFDLVFAQNGVADGGTITSTATVTSNTADPLTTNNTSTGTALAYTPGDLAVSVEGFSIFRAGTFINYTIDITNVGELLAGGATVNFVIPDNAPLDSINASSGFPSLPNLAPGTTGPVSFTLPAGMVSGGDANVTLRLFIEPNVPNGTILAPTATLTGTPPSDDPSNNTGSGNTFILAQGDLVVTQTGPSSIVPGATATYTIKVTNNGPSDSQNVSFSDPLPTGMSFVSLTQNSGPAFTLNTPPAGSGGNVSGSIGTLPTGTSASFTLVAMLAPSASGTSLTNTIAATATTTDLNTANNSASVTTAISPPQADVGVSILGGTATAGSNFTYTLTATNNGPSDAQNVVLTYTLPAGTGFNSIIQTGGPASSTGGPHVGGSGNAVASIPTLPAHTSATYQVSVTVLSSTPAGPLPSALSVTSTTADTNLANNSITDSTSAVATRADLRVTDKAPMMIVDAGSTISPPVPKPAVIIGQNNTFVIDVTNAGPSDAQNVSWTSAIPTGLAFVSVTQASGPAFSFDINLPASGTGSITGNIATLASGQTAEFDVVYLANAVSPGAAIASTASVTSNTTDSNIANNTATANATAYAPADLAVSVEGPSVFRAGTFITYILDVTNVGGIPAGGATITYNIPSNAPLDSIGGSSGFPTLPNPPAGTTGAITFTLPAGMVPGGDANVTIRELISPSVPDGAILAPTASLSGLPASDDPSNNTSAGNTRILAQADLSVTQTGPATVTAGSFANFQVKITNNGPSDSQNVSFVETLPAGIDAQVAGIVQNAGPSFTLSASGGSIATLPAGASATFTLSVQVGSDVTAGTVLTATAAATSPTTDFGTSNNSAQTNTTVQAAQASIIAVPTGTVSSVGTTSTVSPIHGFGRTIRTTLAGFSGVVAQFVDPTPTATSAAALHFHVAINWGDGGLSVGTVTYDKADGRGNVSGSHRYKKKGDYAITVIVQDSAGRKGNITSHAVVGPVLVTPLTKQLV